MTCTARFAEAYEWALFWTIGVVWLSEDRSGGAANAFLTDTQINFRERGALADNGHWLWNLTQSTNGPITTPVTNHTVTATGVTWDDGDVYRISLVNLIERANIEAALDIAASDIHAALHAVNACDCVLSVWGANLLRKLNIIDAASYYQGKCGQPKMTDELKSRFLDWMNTQLELIRKGNTEVCHGATGADWPAMGWADQSLTEFNAAEIIINDIRRNTT